MADKIQQTVATSDSDRKFVAEFYETAELLANCVIEMVETRPANLLSQSMRKLLVDKAKEMLGYSRPLFNRLAADNLGNDLKPWPYQE